MPNGKLSETEYKKLSSLLEDLGKPEVLGALNDKSAEFVRDQVKRHNRYGEEMFVSDKQMSWLTSLHEEFVGTEAAEPKGIDEEMNDEVPY